MDLNKLPSSISNNNQIEKNQNQSAEEVYFSILVANKYNILDFSSIVLNIMAMAVCNDVFKHL